MKNIILNTILFIFIFSSIILSQEVNDSSCADNFSIYLRNIRLELTTVILQNDVTLASDINIYKYGNSYFGIQPGVSFLTVTGLFNSVLEEPFIDCNLVGIYSTSNKYGIYLQFLLGYVYRTSTKVNTKDYPLGMLKYGSSVGWNVSQYINLYIKFSQIQGQPSYKGSAAGLGISFGYWN